MKSKGLIALEAHIEKPEESSIFKRYPRISKDHFALDFICDTLRMMTMSLEDPHQVETAMEKQLEKHHHEALGPADALQTMADGLPALGIVAAVLGVIKTMGAISEPPEVLGRMIGSALVGTFLGVFLAYGIVGPDGDAAESDRRRGRAVLSRHPRHPGRASARQCGAGLRRDRPRQRAVSVAQPSFQELEEALNDDPAGSGARLSAFDFDRLRAIGERHEEAGKRAGHDAERHRIDHIHVGSPGRRWW